MRVVENGGSTSVVQQLTSVVMGPGSWCAIAHRAGTTAVCPPMRNCATEVVLPPSLFELRRTGSLARDDEIAMAHAPAPMAECIDQHRQDRRALMAGRGEQR